MVKVAISGVPSRPPCVLAILWRMAAPIEVEDPAVTDSDDNPGLAPTPIGRLIGESDQTYSAIAERMNRHLGGGASVQRQTVMRWAKKPIIRTPPVEMMQALAGALEVSAALVLRLFVQSHERWCRAQMGLPEAGADGLESQAQALAYRMDALDLERRRRVIWAMRALIDAAEVEAQTAVGRVGVGAQESASARLLRIGDRMLVDIGVAYDDQAVRDEAVAITEFLDRRRKTDDDQAGDPAHP